MYARIGMYRDSLSFPSILNGIPIGATKLSIASSFQRVFVVFRSHLGFVQCIAKSNVSLSSLSKKYPGLPALAHASFGSVGFPVPRTFGASACDTVLAHHLFITFSYSVQHICHSFSYTIYFLLVSYWIILSM